MFNAASCVGAGVYGKRQNSVKTAFKILIASADTPKNSRLSHQSVTFVVFVSFCSIQVVRNFNRRKRRS